MAQPWELRRVDASTRKFVRQEGTSGELQLLNALEETEKEAEKLRDEQRTALAIDDMAKERTSGPGWPD